MADLDDMKKAAEGLASVAGQKAGVLATIVGALVSVATFLRLRKNQEAQRLLTSAQADETEEKTATLHDQRWENLLESVSSRLAVTEGRLAALEIREREIERKNATLRTLVYRLLQKLEEHGISVAGVDLSALEA